MTHEFGGRRSPEAWSSQHDRARARLAERMTEPLEPEESAWLDAHLVDCAACRDIDAAYHSDREYLRAMRVIPPPRDLWARTSAALDMEQARSGGNRRRSRPARRRTTGTVVPFPSGRWAPIGALGSIAAVMVVGFLLGNMLIGTGPASSPIVAIGSTPAPTRNLVPTAIPVPKSDVAWVTTNTDGSIVVNQAEVNGVCPANAPAGCVPIDNNASQVATLSVKPTSVHQSPTSGQLIVFGKTENGTGGMFVMGAGNAPPPTTRPTVAPTVAPSTPPTASASPSSAGASEAPSGSSDTASPSTSATSSPTAPATATPPPTASPTPKATATASIVPNVTPPPSAAALIAIATDLGVLNPETAAYSPDGAWFAFTARRLDDLDGTGSDIYLWHAGDIQARAVTDDGRSVFAGWVGNRLAGSSADLPGGSPLEGGTGGFGTTSFLVDPATLVRTAIPTAAWRPAVDPTGKSVVYWEGTVAVDPASGGWRTATGRLVIRSWQAVSTAASGGASSPAPTASPSVAPSPSASASASASPSLEPGSKATFKPSASPVSTPSAAASTSSTASPSATATPVPTATQPSGLPAGIASAGGVDWAAAWDETGTHLALWIGDKAEPTFGRLSLLTIGANGLPTGGGSVLSDQPALPGFSLADGHLAWATPVGTNGNGSTLVVYAYSGKAPGFGGPGVPGRGPVIVVQH